MPRTKIIMVVLPAALALSLAACGAAPTTQPPAIDVPPPGTMEPNQPGNTPQDVNQLDEALKAMGLDFAITMTEARGFFDQTPVLLTANDEGIEVYQFTDAANADLAAQQIPNILATSRFTEPPHFYHEGQLIALYRGDDTAITGALSELLGPEITADVTVPGTQAGDAETVSEVSLYFIAIGDKGSQGDLIGCEDSVVAVPHTLAAPSASPIEAALNELLSIKDKEVGDAKLYNSLYQSNLTVESATVNNGLATVYLTGEFALGGECDSPRFKGQLEYTVLQFPGVEAVEVYINNQKLDDLLSGQG